MMSVIDIPADAIAQRAADQNVRKIMIASREASHTHRTRNSISRDLHRRMIVIFVRYDRCQRPCFDTVPGRKRRSAIEEITAALAPRRSRALRDFLDRGHYDCAVD